MAKYKINSEMPLDINEFPEQFDPLFDKTYELFLDHFSESFQSSLKIDKNISSAPITFRSKIFRAFIEDFDKIHENILSTRSKLVGEMYLIYQFAKALQRYNDDVLKISYVAFRAQYYFPNIVYLLIRYLPETRLFLQQMIKSAYYIIKKNNARITYLYENSVCSDEGTIRTDILYTYLGNAIKKINPLNIDNLNAFYRQVFINHFFYFFKFEQVVHSQVVDAMSMVDISDTRFISTRENLYRDVLTNMQVETFKNESPTMRQIYYNYSIFKNFITNNEFQNIFLTSKSTINCDFVNLKNTQYKVMSMYNKIESDDEFLLKLKELPIIYKLLKSVHLISKTDAIPKFNTINCDILTNTVIEELSFPFKNLLNTDNSVLEIIKKIANNFVNSILQGEYINLQTLAPISIDHMSFVVQLRKFIKMCLSIKQPNFIMSNSIKLGML